MEHWKRNLSLIFGLGVVSFGVFFLPGILFQEKYQPEVLSIETNEISKEVILPAPAELKKTKTSSAGSPDALFGASRDEVPHISTPEHVRGVYMTSWVAGIPRLRDQVIELIEETSINTLVIDVKDYTGNIAFKIDSRELEKIGAFENRIPDISELLEELHDRGVYVIARIVVFQDPHIAEAWPKQAVQDLEGETWQDKKGSSWVDPASQDMWEYIATLSQEAYGLGFDEINYDYVRFPTDGNLSEIIYPLSGERLLTEHRQDILRDFFSYLDKEIRSQGIPVSADVFGLTTVAHDDIGIGQVLEEIAPFVDFVAPMVYPSHFAKGWGGYPNPAEYPYEVIYETMEQAKEKLESVGEHASKLRPWIQDFNLGANYGEREVSLQIQALEDAGITSWMSWNPSNRYNTNAYKLD